MAGRHFTLLLVLLGLLSPVTRAENCPAAMEGVAAAPPLYRGGAAERMLLTVVDKSDKVLPASLLMYSIYRSGLAIPRGVLVTPDVPEQQREMLSYFATVIEVDPVPHAHTVPVAIRARQLRAAGVRAAVLISNEYIVKDATVLRDMLGQIGKPGCSEDMKLVSIHTDGDPIAFDDLLVANGTAALATLCPWPLQEGLLNGLRAALEHVDGMVQVTKEADRVVGCDATHQQVTGGAARYRLFRQLSTTVPRMEKQLREDGLLRTTDAVVLGALLDRLRGPLPLAASPKVAEYGWEGSLAAPSVAAEIEVVLPGTQFAQFVGLPYRRSEFAAALSADIHWMLPELQPGEYGVVNLKFKVYEARFGVVLTPTDGRLRYTAEQIAAKLSTASRESWRAASNVYKSLTGFEMDIATYAPHTFFPPTTRAPRVDEGETMTLPPTLKPMAPTSLPPHTEQPYEKPTIDAAAKQALAEARGE
jgi:hypothetical protein